jgi:hypothetical protein
LLPLPDFDERLMTEGMRDGEKFTIAIVRINASFTIARTNDASGWGPIVSSV